MKRPERRTGIDRRQFLHAATAAVPAGLAVLGLSGCGAPAAIDGTPAAEPAPGSPGDTPVRAPRINGAINLHPVRRLGEPPAPNDPTIIPELISLQLDSVYSLGFDGIRITAPFSDRGSFLAAIAYARAARAVGVDAVVVLSEFAGLTLPQALADDQMRAVALGLYGSVFVPPPLPARPGMGGLGPKGVGRIALQVLNEPALFCGIPPATYVTDFLAPCYNFLKATYPDAIVVSAAEVGTKAGPARMRAMLEAGLERVTDRVAFHVYDRDIIPLLGSNVRSLVWVTESGSSGTTSHLPWVRDVFPDIGAGIGDASRIFFYDLYDSAPGGYRIIDLRQTGDRYEMTVESQDLYTYWKDRVAVAAGAPIIPFSTLIPDIRAYLPTAADIAAYDATLEEVLGS